MDRSIMNECINKKMIVDSEMLEEIRSACAKHGQMPLFTEICELLGRPEDDDYEYVDDSESDSDSDTDDEGVVMGKIEPEVINSEVVGGFHRLT